MICWRSTVIYLCVATSIEHMIVAAYFLYGTYFTHPDHEKLDHTIRNVTRMGGDASSRAVAVRETRI